MNTEPNDIPGITFSVFHESGQPLHTKWISIDGEELSHQLIGKLSNHLRHLSGDLDLPLEGHLPLGESEIAFRITSDLRNSFTFYYLGNEVIGLSLTLLGGDPDPEAEMIDSIRLLLLDQAEEEELDDEQIEQTLSINQFEFHSFSQRPIHFFVPFETQCVAENWQKTQDTLIHGSLHLAMALFQPVD